MVRSRWFLPCAVLALASLYAGCGQSAPLVPGAYASGWALVLEDENGWPQEDFTFDVYPDGSAATTVRTVGSCTPAGLLTLSFTGWQGDTVTGTVTLQTNGVGAGTWTRSGAHPSSGSARLTRQWDTPHAGNYQLVWDGDAATASSISISADGVVWMGAVGTGVVGNGGAVVITLRESEATGGGPIVLTGTLTAAGVEGTYVNLNGGIGTWTADPT